MSLTDRERFNAVVLTAPLKRADAIVCLCGQDGLERAKVAQELLLQGAAPVIVLSGGLESKDKQGAKGVSEKLIGNGVSPERITTETESTNTAEQAERVAELAGAYVWKQILLIGSPQHLPRAFLTFVKAFEGMEVKIVPVTANHLPWWGKPEGVTTTRLALLDSEYKKIEQHQASGDVASYAEGLKHLKSLEGK